MVWRFESSSGHQFIGLVFRFVRLPVWPKVPLQSILQRDFFRLFFGPSQRPRRSASWPEMRSAAEVSRARPWGKHDRHVFVAIRPRARLWTCSLAVFPNTVVPATQ